MKAYLIINIHTGIIHGGFTTFEKAEIFLSNIPNRGNFTVMELELL